MSNPNESTMTAKPRMILQYEITKSVVRTASYFPILRRWLQWKSVLLWILGVAELYYLSWEPFAGLSIKGSYPVIMSVSNTIVAIGLIFGFFIVLIEFQIAKQFRPYGKELRGGSAQIFENFIRLIPNDGDSIADYYLGEDSRIELSNRWLFLHFPNKHFVAFDIRTLPSYEDKSRMQMELQRLINNGVNAPDLPGPNQLERAVQFTYSLSEQVSIQRRLLKRANDRLAIIVLTLATLVVIAVADLALNYRSYILIHSPYVFQSIAAVGYISLFFIFGSRNPRMIAKQTNKILLKQGPISILAASDKLYWKNGCALICCPYSDLTNVSNDGHMIIIDMPRARSLNIPTRIFSSEVGVELFCIDLQSLKNGETLSATQQRSDTTVWPPPPMIA